MKMFLTIVVLVLSFGTVVTASDVGPKSHDEASLRGVTFIDPDRGWAAGDRGTVLYTEDRGESWNPQPSGTTVSLADIAMYNSKRGLAIGGYYQGYTQLSIGEVIITDNGGQSWRQIAGHDLPRLRQLIIGPGGMCIAVGDWSPVHLTSVFASRNGGQTWQPQPCKIFGAAVSIAGTVDDYLVLSDQGEVVRFRNDLNPQSLFPPGGEWQLVAGRENQRILVGERGMIESQDQGETWQVNPKHLEAATAFAPASIELGETATAAIWKNEVWAASDANSSMVTFRPASVDAVPHQAQASIRRIIRLDGDRGWAVGDFGLILATRDAGKSWRTLRGGNRLPALMVVGSQPVSLPWNLLAIESLQHLRRVSIVIDRAEQQATDQKGSQHQGAGYKVTSIERDGICDATASLGPSSIFVASSAGNRIAEILRTSKPAVVVLDQTLQPDQRAAWSAAALEAGVQRVLEIGEHGTQTVHVAAAIPTAGILASDVWFDAIAILSPQYLPPSKVMLSARLDATNDRLAGGGLATCVGNDPRYRWSKETTNSRRQLQVLQARTTELNWIESLVSSSKSPAEFKSLLASVLPRTVDSDRQKVFSRLIALTGKQARHDLHIAALEAFIDDAQQRSDNISPLKNDLLKLANLRLKAVRGSSEWHQTFNVSGMALTSPNIAVATASAAAPINLAVQLSPFQTQTSQSRNLGSRIQLAGGFAPSGDALSQSVALASGTTENKSRSDLASAPVVNIRPVDLRWELHPAVLMVGRANELHERKLAVPLQTLDLSILDRAQPIDEADSGSTASNHANDSSAIFTSLRRLAENSVSGQWANLASDRQLPAMINCPHTDSRPTLNGSFDEAWWGESEPLSKVGTVRLGHDDDFFYVALDMPVLQAARQNTKIRQRDTPLDASDRYCIRLDIDRDLMTAYEFEFDSAGNTRESCDGFLQFQPRWFIACQEIGGRTIAEIAIQKSDILPDFASRGTIWNMSIERWTNEAPGRGIVVPDAAAWHAVQLQ